MPPPTPTGCLMLPLHYARETLAACATWQSVCGVATAEAARARIHLEEWDEHSPASGRPRVLLNLLSGTDNEKLNSSGWLGKGQIAMAIEVANPPAYQSQPGYARIWFLSLIGTILDEMKALAGQAGYLNILQVTEQISGRSLPNEENGDEFWGSSWVLRWLN